MKNLKLILIVFVALLIVGAADAQKYELKFNLAPGTNWKAKQSSIMDINQQVMGMSNDMKMTVEAITAYSVEKVVDGNFYLTFTYDAMLMKIESPMMNMSYDSKQPVDAQNPFGTTIGSMIGEKFEVVMDSKGKVKSVNGFDRIMDKMVKSTGGDQSTKEQVIASIKQQFGDEAIKGSIEMSTALFPATMVGIGDTWIVESMVPVNVQLISKSTLTLKDVKDGKWYLEGTSVLNSNKDAGIQANGMTQHMDLKGTSAFKTEVNSTTGWVVESVVNQNIEGVVVIEGGQLPSSMEIPMKIKGTTTVTAM